MARHGVEIHGPNKEEMLRYQAEDMAREAMKQHPLYKEMVENAMHHLKESQKDMMKMGKRLPMKKGSKAAMASVAPPGVARLEAPA